MTQPRQIAIITDYLGLIAALRSRADELRISREALDHLTGLQSGYSGKLLAPVPLRALGRTSLGPMLGAMGLKIVLVEDLAAFKRVESRIKRQATTGGSVPAKKRNRRRSRLRGCSDWGKLMRARQIALMTDRQRSDSARRAIRIRWRRVRAEKRASKSSANAGALPVSI